MIQTINQLGYHTIRQVTMITMEETCLDTFSSVTKWQKCSTLRQKSWMESILQQKRHYICKSATEKLTTAIFHIQKQRFLVHSMKREKRERLVLRTSRDEGHGWVNAHRILLLKGHLIWHTSSSDAEIIQRLQFSTYKHWRLRKMASR